MLTLTADRGSSWSAVLNLVVVAFVAVAGYLAVCQIWPYASCRKCKGDGKWRSASGRAWRTCRRCKGTGERRRAGTVLLVAARSKGRQP